MSTEEIDDFSNLEMEEHLKIPLNRIGVIIGKKGTTKARIEKLTQTSLSIDSESGDITIKPTEDLDDPTKVWTARDIVKAIGRGFRVTGQWNSGNLDGSSRPSLRTRPELSALPP